LHHHDFVCWLQHVQIKTFWMKSKADNPSHGQHVALTVLSVPYSLHSRSVSLVGISRASRRLVVFGATGADEKVLDKEQSRQPHPEAQHLCAKYQSSQETF
jgi:hypothetical protein